MHTQSLHFKKWFAANKDSLPEYLTYDPENPFFPRDDPFLAECVKEIESLKERIDNEELKLPRGDYEHEWELIQVMMLSSIVLWIDHEEKCRCCKS